MNIKQVAKRRHQIILMLKLEKKKIHGWITEEFNSTSPNLYYRPLESLRKFYDKLKEDLRKRCAEKKKDRYKTGGGPAEIKDHTGDDELLLSIVNSKSVVAEENICEEILNISNIDTSSDVQEEGVLQKLENINTAGDKVEIIYELNESNKENDWRKSESLKRPRNNILDQNLKKTYNIQESKKKCLAPSRRRPNTVVPLTSSRLGEKYEKLVDKKFELAGCFKKEHELRTQSLELYIAIKRKQLSQNIQMAFSDQQ